MTSDRLPKAASSGDFNLLKRLLASGEHIESKGPQSWTETTISGTHSDGTPVYTTTRHTFPETTALYRAACAGWFEVAHFLIRKGANVSTRDGYDGGIGDPMLFNVIKNGQEKMARLLLEYEAKMEAFGARTALHVAVSQPERSLVRLLLDFGAHIDAKDEQNQTPLYLACLDGFSSIIQLLLEEGAQTNHVVGGRTALYKACGMDRNDIVDLLLRYGADPAVGRGRHGETMIYKAAWYNDLNVVECLLNFEADVNLCNNRKMKSYKGFSEIVLDGVVAGLSKEHAVVNAWGKTALHAAAYQGHEEMVQLLLHAGANLEAAGDDSLTPAYLAAQQNQAGTVQMLLEAGAQRQTEGTPDVLVGLVAHITRELSSSRRLTEK